MLAWITETHIEYSYPLNSHFFLLKNKTAVVENGKVVNDARGAVFQFIRASDRHLISINSNGTYKGNVVADMQIMVAKAILDGTLQNTPELQTTVNSIDETIIN